MSTSDELLDFDDWLRAEYAAKDGFTALVVLLAIGDMDAKPVASTFFHVVGDGATWSDIRKMFASAPGGWDGAAFFPLRSREGGLLEEPLARIELRRIEATIADDRLALNDGAFFDRKGRRMRIDAVDP